MSALSKPYTQNGDQHVQRTKTKFSLGNDTDIVLAFLTFC
jgi:hypothetical protein